MNWIRLGLQDVLYDPETNTVYTPNTNQTAVMGVSKLPVAGGMKPRDPPLLERAENGIIEELGGRYIQGPDGKMQGSLPEGGGYAGGGDPKSPFSKKPLFLPKKEYAHVTSEISTHFEAKYKGKTRGFIRLSGGTYHFEIKEFRDYNIYKKTNRR